jgi:hypothetical protein
MENQFSQLERGDKLFPLRAVRGVDWNGERSGGRRRGAPSRFSIFLSLGYAGFHPWQISETYMWVYVPR